MAIKMGGSEQNLLVSHFMQLDPWRGLLLAKLIVLAIAVIVIAARKRRVLRWANIFYSCVVVWNVIVIARLAGHASQV